MEIPDWIAAVLTDQVESATDAVTSADTLEKLWSAKGRLEALRKAQSEIVLMKESLEAQEREHVEGYLVHGN